VAGAVALADVADVAPHARGVLGHVAAHDPGGARGRLQQRREHAESGRLAGAVGPEDRHHLALPHLEVKGAHGLDGLVADPERAGQASCFDHVCSSWSRLDFGDRTTLATIAATS
jgi:hypothetical protein